MILRRNRSDPPALRMLFEAGTATGLTDGQLLERFATHGDDAAEPAFAALVERHGPMVWRVCRAILRDDHAAEDAFQATFLVLVRRAGSLWVRDSLGPWLHRVASRAAVRARVGAGRRRAAEREAMAMSARSESGAIGEEIAGLIHAEIDRLPDRFRMPVVLCDVEGRTYEEAARHLRCPVGTVKSRLARGRERLRGRLARGGLSIAGLAPEVIPAPPTPLVRAAVRAAMGDAAGGGVVSASVASLARRISMAMFWRQMRGLGISGLAVVAAVVGAGLLVRAAVEVEPGRHTPAPPLRVAQPKPDRPPVKPLTGIVRDPEGRPVAFARVVAGEFNGKPNHQTGTTGPDGRFELTPGGDASRLEFVVAYKEGLAPSSTWIREAVEGKGQGGNVELLLSRPAPFVGIVKDREGRPIAGASVWFKDAWYPGDGGRDLLLNGIEDIVRGTALESLFRAKTDAHGRFELPNLPGGARASLVVTAAGMGEYSTQNRKRADGKTGHEGTAEAPAEIVMAPAARVVGRVVTRFPSVKVAGLKVGMQGSRETQGIWRDTQTDVDGRFTFDGLDEGTANIFLMDHPNDGPWTYRAAADTELKPGRTTEIEIELIRGVQVEGRVVDANSGRRVAGVGVGLYGPIRPRSGAAIISERTDQDGRYRFRLPPGETQFYICGPAPAEYGRMPGGGHTVLIPADAREFTVPLIELRKGEPGP